VVLAFIFLAVMGVVLWMGMIPLERDDLHDIVRMRVMLYGLAAGAALVISVVSMIYRWGAMGSGKGIFVLVVLSGLYSAMVNAFYDQITDIPNRQIWQAIITALGTAVMTGVAVGLLVWMTVRIYDHGRLTKFGKFVLYVFIAAVTGGGWFYILAYVDNILVDILMSPFRSVPFVWAAVLPGILILRWAEEA
jgi:hypothetical protein